MTQTISAAFTKTRQGYRYTRTESHDGYKLSIEVYVDSYAFQSYAWVKVWSPLELKWNQVVYWEGERFADQMASPYVPVERRSEQEGDCLQLAEEMVTVAKEVLG